MILPFPRKIKKAADGRRSEEENMSYLRCDARGCSNNRAELCLLEQIQVDGRNARERKDTRCESFTLRGPDYSNAVERAFEPRPETEVSCGADSCVYNRDCRCHAPSVDIGGQGASDPAQTECRTFDKR